MSLVLASEFQHFTRHILTVGFAAWGNTSRESKTSMPPPLPRPKTVSPCLSSASGWIAASQLSEERALRQFTLLPFVVEI